jgi:endo-1,4-beta-D-glucanase Y
MEKEPPKSLMSLISNSFEKDRIRMAWKMGYAAGWQEAVAVVDEAISQLRANYGTKGYEWLSIDYINGAESIQTILESIGG